MRATSHLLSESLIQANYPGANLPPLWQVIYQEAMRGHHLLFRRDDVETYEALDAATTDSRNYDIELSDELEIAVLKVVGCADLSAMVKVIDTLPGTTRRALYQFYKRALWIWRNYVKDNLH